MVRRARNNPNDDAIAAMRRVFPEDPDRERKYIIKKFVSTMRGLYRTAEFVQEDIAQEKAVASFAEELDSPDYTMEKQAIAWVIKYSSPDMVERIAALQQHDEATLIGIFKDAALYAPKLLNEATLEYETAMYAYKIKDVTELTIDPVDLAEYTAELDESAFKEALYSLDFTWMWEDRRNTGEVKSLADTRKENTFIYVDLTHKGISFKPHIPYLQQLLDRVALPSELPVNQAETVYSFDDGSYVVELTAEHLREEGAALGICVGQSKMGYKKSVKTGKMRIFSLRTAEGKAKFTISYDVDSEEVKEVKGKANRIPGFSHTMTPGEKLKVDEVEKCSEFITEYLNYSEDDLFQVFDLKPGLIALADWVKARAEKVAREKAEKAEKRGTRNPSRRRNPEPAVPTVSARAARAAQKAYEMPWGGVWGR